MKELTPGTTTSEFKITMYLNLLGMGLTAFGFVDPTDIEGVLQELAVVLGCVMTIISSVTYVWSRVHLKERFMINESKEKVKTLPVILDTKSLG